MQENLIKKIPKEVRETLKTLEKGGFEAYLVGGCVRDLIMKNPPDGGPKDWDITTNATPEKIIGLFPKTVYENKFGTVAVVNEIISDETLKIIEITPYRLESKYSDFRHPDEIKFSKNLGDDLKRRDFTVNALALNSKGQLIDLFEGVKDIENKTLRAVGNPAERLGEDALRMVRAVRFAVQLDFSVSHETSDVIIKRAELIKKISAERIRDEFQKIIMSPEPMVGIGLLQKFNLLQYIIPELEEGIKCEQGGAHLFDVFEHLLQALQHSANKKLPLDIRLSALFHDIGKPRTRRLANLAPQGRTLGIQKDPTFSRQRPYTFYGHEVVGARMAKKILERLKFPKDLIEKVVKLVRYHMFFSDTKQITLSAVRRIIVNVGRENIWDLMQIRECDRVGMAKKEAPYRLRKYHAMIEEALRAPTSVGMLKINGEIMISELQISPGPRMGWILHALLEECLEDDKKNELGYLKTRALELNKISDTELKKLGEAGKEKKEEVEEQEIEKLRAKHGVRK